MSKRWKRCGRLIVEYDTNTPIANMLGTFDEYVKDAIKIVKAPEMLEALNALAYAYGKKKGPFVLAGALLKEDAIRTAWKMAMKVLAEVEDE